MLSLDQQNKEELTVREAPPSDPEELSQTSSRSSSNISDKIQTTSSKKTCMFFRKTGNCRFGEDCRFAHIQKENLQTKSGNKSVKKNEENNSVEESSKRKHENPTQSVKEKPKGNCYLFKKNGRCRYGIHCRFQHGKSHAKTNGSKNKSEKPTNETSFEDEPLSNEIAAKSSVSESYTNQAGDGSNKSKSKEVKQRRKVCRYYKEGSCNMADRCRFWHPQDPAELDDVKDQRSSNGAVSKREISQRPHSSLNLAEASEEDFKSLMVSEIIQLKVIFQEEGKLSILEEEGELVVYRVVISPSDPEWPYDITDFIFDVSFPENYPKEPFIIKISDDQELPDVIIRHINEASQNWVSAKHQTNLMGGKIELIFRPFLRWLDRSLENLFTEGARKYKRCLDAKAAGFEFIPHKVKEEMIDEKVDSVSIEKDKKSAVEDNEPKENEQDEDSDSEDEEEDEGEESGTDEEESGDSSEEEERNTIKYRQRNIEQPHEIDPQRKGTELRFKGLEMGDGYGTLTVRKLALTVQCERCKHRTDINTPGGRTNLIFCPRCQQQFLLTYRPAIMHQFSAILGYLDLNGCLPFDVLVMDCELDSTCLSCNHQKQIKGLQYGQTLSSWCPKCHNKQSLRVDSTRVQRLFASDPIATERLHTVQVQSVVRSKKDPAMQEGKPLPSNGTCHHYKKSYRWLRFPCCGKCYPCDQCHDDDSDHIFTFANRMICGFCAKEQTFSPDSPCILCHMSLTKAWSSHWEGGQGCRNRIKMNKGDKQKHSGKNKTLSKKAKEKKEGHSKKSKSK